MSLQSLKNISIQNSLGLKELSTPSHHGKYAAQLSPLPTPPRSPIICIRCNSVLTEGHFCFQEKVLRESLSFPCSPSTSSKYQLSPLRKRSFDVWTESDGGNDSDEEPQSPHKIEKIDRYSFSLGNGSEQLGLNDHEIINLPVNNKATSKLVHTKLRRSKSKLLTRKTKPLTAFSIRDCFAKTFGHRSEVSPTSERKSSGSSASKNNSSSPGLSGLSSQLEQQTIATRSVPPPIHAFCDPSENLLTSASHGEESDHIPTTDAVASSTFSTKLTGIGITELENELSDLDLAAAILDVNESTVEWQKLVIQTPTNRSKFPKSHSPRRAVSVSETIFDEGEQEPEASSFATKLVEQQVRENGLRPLNIIIDKPHQKIIISSPRNHSRLVSPMHSTVQKGRPVEDTSAELMDLILAQENTDSLFNLIESLNPSMVSLDVIDFANEEEEDGEEEVFKYLSQFE